VTANDGNPRSPRSRLICSLYRRRYFLSGAQFKEPVAGLGDLDHLQVGHVDRRPLVLRRHLPVVVNIADPLVQLVDDLVELVAGRKRLGCSFAAVFAAAGSCFIRFIERCLCRLAIGISIVKILDRLCPRIGEPGGKRLQQRGVGGGPCRPGAVGLGPVHYLLTRRNSSIASRIASFRSQFFLSVHRLIRASFPFLEVVMKAVLNSYSIRQSTLGPSDAGGSTGRAF
jgi:hypothetical protein